MRSSLRTLDLSRNQLKRLPDNFGELDQLVFLDIHQNKVRKQKMKQITLYRYTIEIKRFIFSFYALSS